MSEYIGLALIRHDGCEKPFLFQYPAFMNCKEGMMARVMTKRGEAIGTVVWADNVCKDRDEYKGIVIASGSEEPIMPVLAVAEWHEIAWEDETDEYRDPVGTDNG